MISDSSFVAANVAACCRSSVADLEPLIVARLEDAGRVLLALPEKGHTTALRTGHPEVVHDVREAYGWMPMPLRAPVPSARRITRMEEALSWISMLPDDEARLRRVLGLRMLVHPLNDKHLYSWRKVGRAFGVNHETARAWHQNAIGMLAIRLLFLSVSV